MPLYYPRVNLPKIKPQKVYFCLLCFQSQIICDTRESACELVNLLSGWQIRRSLIAGITKLRYMCQYIILWPKYLINFYTFTDSFLAICGPCLFDPFSRKVHNVPFKNLWDLTPQFLVQLPNPSFRNFVLSLIIARKLVNQKRDAFQMQYNQTSLYRHPI